MSVGKMNAFGVFLRFTKEKDEEGFVHEDFEIIADVRVYREGRHGSARWANLAHFSEATDLFRFRRIPDVEIRAGDVIVCEAGWFEIFFVDNVQGKNRYIEVLAKRVDPIGEIED